MRANDLYVKILCATIGVLVVLVGSFVSLTAYFVSSQLKEIEENSKEIKVSTRATEIEIAKRGTLLLTLDECCKDVKKNTLAINELRLMSERR